MHFQFGTDEAGYGPNLGPLVITGTGWTSEGPCDLYEVLSDVCSRNRKVGRLQVADSKSVYGGKLDRLELPVLSFLMAAETGPEMPHLPATLSELTSRLNGGHDWEASKKSGFRDLGLPLVANAQEIERQASRIRLVLRKNRTQLSHIESRVILPFAYNDLLHQKGNKANLLSEVTLEIVRVLIERKNDRCQHCIGVCDKHGGRSSYAALLQQHVVGDLVATLSEGRQVSRYRWRCQNVDYQIDFARSGEFFFATALASMISKYVRELFMASWNQFWSEKIADLKPTKGYPVDAKRFMTEIKGTQRALGIDDAEIWRIR